MLSPTPYRAALAVVGGFVGKEWHDWFRQIAAAIDAAGQRVGTPSSLSAQSASLAATTLLTVTATGLYRISYYLRITQAASVSSSATVTFRWTDGGVACAVSFGAVTGNTTDTVASNLRLVRADTGTAITVEVLYASVGATAMNYALDSRIEAIP